MSAPAPPRLVDLAAAASARLLTAELAAWLRDGHDASLTEAGWRTQNELARIRALPAHLLCAIVRHASPLGLTWLESDCGDDLVLRACASAWQRPVLGCGDEISADWRLTAERSLFSFARMPSPSAREWTEIARCERGEMGRRACAHRGSKDEEDAQEPWSLAALKRLQLLSLPLLSTVHLHGAQLHAGFTDPAAKMFGVLPLAELLRRATTVLVDGCSAKAASFLLNILFPLRVRELVLLWPSSEACAPLCRSLGTPLIHVTTLVLVSVRFTACASDDLASVLLQPPLQAGLVRLGLDRVMFNDVPAQAAVLVAVCTLRALRGFSLSLESRDGEPLLSTVQAQQLHLGPCGDGPCLEALSLGRARDLPVIMGLSLRSVRTLALRLVSASDEAILCACLESGAAPHLSTLLVSRLSPAAAERLCWALASEAAAPLPLSSFGLTQLRLADNAGRSETSLSALTASLDAALRNHTSSLTWLDLSGLGLNSPCLTVLAPGLRTLTSLSSLRLDSNNLGAGLDRGGEDEEALVHLLCGAYMPRLRWLSLSSNRLSGALCEHAATRTAAWVEGALESVDLRGNFAVTRATVRDWPSRVSVYLSMGPHVVDGLLDV